MAPAMYAVGQKRQTRLEINKLALPFEQVRDLRAFVDWTSVAMTV